MLFPNDLGFVAFLRRLDLLIFQADTLLTSMEYTKGNLWTMLRTVIGDIPE